MHSFSAVFLEYSLLDFIFKFPNFSEFLSFSVLFNITAQLYFYLYAQVRVPVSIALTVAKVWPWGEGWIPRDPQRDIAFFLMIFVSFRRRSPRSLLTCFYLHRVDS